MKDPLHRIKDIKKLAKHLAKNIAMDCGFTIEELKQYMSVKNAINIIKEHAQKDKDGEFLINTRILETICVDMSGWLLGVNLAKLAADDKLDCYWDSKKDCMVFKKKDQ
jgi:hypothetical protein